MRLGLLLAATMVAYFVGARVGGGVLAGLVAALVLHSFVVVATLMRLSEWYSDWRWTLAGLDNAVESIEERLRVIEEYLRE